jgi:hypothetical protein
VSHSHTDKDFDALRARLIALVKSVFPPFCDHWGLGSSELGETTELH